MPGGCCHLRMLSRLPNLSIPQQGVFITQLAPTRRLSDGETGTVNKLRMSRQCRHMSFLVSELDSQELDLVYTLLKCSPGKNQYTANV